MIDYRTAIEKALIRNSLTVFCDSRCIELFSCLAERLVAVNAQYNLTAITEPEKIATRHIADSLMAAEFLPEGANVVDVGCGAGFPSLPLAIARPDLHILALDSTAKKLHFVESTAKELGLSHLTVLAARAEEEGQKRLREKFDVAIARAVAHLPILSELCLPLVKVGGCFVAMKGSGGLLEVEEATKAFSHLGASLSGVYKFSLQELNEETADRWIAVVEKSGRTPQEYPRNYSKICKKPL